VVLLRSDDGDRAVVSHPWVVSPEVGVEAAVTTHQWCSDADLIGGGLIGAGWGDHRVLRAAVEESKGADDVGLKRGSVHL
jgi:hypothetical protein